jgi:membrane protein
MRAFNQSVLVTETRPGYRIRMISLLLVGIVSFIIIIAGGLQVMSYRLISILTHNFTISPFLFKAMFFMVKYLIFIAILFSVFSFIYYLAPAHRGMYRFISPGSTLATISAIITLEVFSYFINNFGHYNKLYGSLGTLIVILIWINLNAMILLIGFELNASIYSAKVSSDQADE